jgi:hypothetical protein
MLKTLQEAGFVLETNGVLENSLQLLKLESFQDWDTLIIVRVDSAGLPSIEYCGRAAMFIGKFLHFFD